MLSPAPACIEACPSICLPAATFVLEIGSEELPPEDVVSAMEQLKWVLHSECCIPGVALGLLHACPPCARTSCETHACSPAFARGLSLCRERFPALLDRLRLGHGGVTVEGTPRRLAVIVHKLVGRQSNSAENVRGPPAKVSAPLLLLLMLLLLLPPLLRTVALFFQCASTTRLGSARCCCRFSCCRQACP